MFVAVFPTCHCSERKKKKKGYFFPLDVFERHAEKRRVSSPSPSHIVTVLLKTAYRRCLEEKKHTTSKKRKNEEAVWIVEGFCDWSRRSADQSQNPSAPNHGAPPFLVSCQFHFLLLKKTSSKVASCKKKCRTKKWSNSVLHVISLFCAFWSKGIELKWEKSVRERPATTLVIRIHEADFVDWTAPLHITHLADTSAWREYVPNGWRSSWGCATEWCTAMSHVFFIAASNSCL